MASRCRGRFCCVISREIRLIISEMRSVDFRWIRPFTIRWTGQGIIFCWNLLRIDGRLIINCWWLLPGLRFGNIQRRNHNSRWIDFIPARIRHNTSNISLSTPWWILSLFLPLSNVRYRKGPCDWERRDNGQSLETFISTRSNDFSQEKVSLNIS